MSDVAVYLLEGGLAAVLLLLATACLGMILGILKDVVDDIGGRAFLRRLLLASAVIVGVTILLIGLGYVLTEFLDVSIIEGLKSEGEQSYRGFAAETSEGRQ